MQGLRTAPRTASTPPLPAPMDIPLHDLPQPTRKLEQLHADLFRCGFCYIEDGVSRDKLSRLQSRLAEQAAAENKAGLAVRDGGKQKHEMRGRQAHNDSHPNQKVLMLVNKGEIFRELGDRVPNATFAIGNADVRATRTRMHTLFALTTHHFSF